MSSRCCLSNSGALTVAAASEYTLDPEELKKRFAADEDDDSSSSDTVSSNEDDEDDDRVPHIIAVEKQASADNIRIENTAGWKYEEGQATQPQQSSGMVDDNKWEVCLSVFEPFSLTCSFLFSRSLQARTHARRT